MEFPWSPLYARKKTDYLSFLDGHVATSSQKDVWLGLRLLLHPLKHRQIFERPTELDPTGLLALQRLGRQPEPFDPSTQEPEAVREDFWQLKELAEDTYPSLTRTSTSS